MELPTLSSAIQEYVDSTRETSHNRIYRERLNSNLTTFYQPVIHNRISEVTPAVLRKLFTGSEVQAVHGLDEGLLYLDDLHPKIKQYIIRLHLNFWDWLVTKYKLVQPMVIANEEDLRAAVRPLSPEEIEICIERCKYLFDSQHKVVGKNPFAIRDKAIFLFMLDTGQYIDRVVDLRIPYINLEKGIYDRRRNDYEYLEMPLSLRTIEALQAQLERRKSEGKLENWDYVFGGGSRERVSYREVEELLKNIMESDDWGPAYFRLKKTFALTYIMGYRSYINLELSTERKILGLYAIKYAYNLTDKEIAATKIKYVDHDRY